MDQRFAPEWNHNGNHSPESMNGNGNAYQTSNGNFYQNGYSSYNPTGPLNRQPSRQFDNYSPYATGLYAPEDHGLRYSGMTLNGPSPPQRVPSSTLHSNYQYDTQTWNYGGANTANTTAGTGRLRAPGQSRRAGLPNVILSVNMCASVYANLDSGMDAISRSHQSPTTQPTVRSLPSSKSKKNFPASDRR